MKNGNQQKKTTQNLGTGRVSKIDGISDIKSDSFPNSFLSRSMLSLIVNKKSLDDLLSSKTSASHNISY